MVRYGGWGGSAYGCIGDGSTNGYRSLPIQLNGAGWKKLKLADKPHSR